MRENKHSHTFAYMHFTSDARKIATTSESDRIPSQIRAHRPDIAPGQKHIQWTESHQLAAQGIPPCALRLWQYLLTKSPASIPQEIDIRELRSEIAAGRIDASGQSKPYSVQSLKYAIWKVLVPQGLIKVEKVYSKTVLTVTTIPLITYDPEAQEPERIKRYTEKIIRDRLKQALGGETEVCTPVGKIDLLTSCQIIEVKPIKSWKSALGQLIAYAYFYPKHEKRLHLFGKQPKTLDLIKHVCKQYSVIVTFQEVL